MDRRYKSYDGRLSIIIHPTAYVSPKATIKPGTAILLKDVVNTFAIIGEGAIINTGAIVVHNTMYHMCVGAIVKADDIIPTGIEIGAGVVIERGEYK